MISGRILYELRSSRGLTLEQASEIIGVHKSTLCRYEQEETITLRPPVLDAVCRLYGVTPALLEAEGPEEVLWYPLLSPTEVAEAYAKLPERDRIRISRMLLPDPAKR